MVWNPAFEARPNFIIERHGPNNSEEILVIAFPESVPRLPLFRRLQAQANARVPVDGASREFDFLTRPATPEDEERWARPEVQRWRKNENGEDEPDCYMCGFDRTCYVCTGGTANEPGSSSDQPAESTTSQVAPAADTSADKENHAMWIRDGNVWYLHPLCNDALTPEAVLFSLGDLRMTLQQFEEATEQALKRIRNSTPSACMTQ